MVTLQDVDPGQWLSDTLPLTVTEVRESQQQNRDSVVYFEDPTGKESYLIDWSRLDLGVEWTVGSDYTISGVSVKEGGRGYRVYLDPTSSAEIVKTESSGESRVLVMGDSHVGRETNPKGSREIDCARQFDEAIRAAIELDVDAVVHTGDVFHDQVSECDLKIVDRSLEQLNGNRIPFYYILGNHECRDGKGLLEQHEDGGAAVHLGLSGVRISADVVLYGLDYHNPSEFPVKIVSDVPGSTGRNEVLVLHQTLSSIRVHGNLDLPKAALSRYAYVLAGDLHDAEHHDWPSGGVLYAGSTEWLSKNRSPSTPAVWLLTIGGGDEPTIDEYPIA